MLSDQMTDTFVAMLVLLGQNSNPHSVKSLSKLTCNTLILILAKLVLLSSLEWHVGGGSEYQTKH